MRIDGSESVSVCNSSHSSLTSVYGRAELLLLSVCGDFVKLHSCSVTQVLLAE